MTNTSALPASIPKNYDFLKFWKDGSLLLGASDLTGRLWTGTMCHFQQADKAPDLQYCTAAKEVESGVCDAVVLPLEDQSNHKAVVGYDYGGIEMLELIHDESGDGAPIFTNTACSCEHDDVVISVSLNSKADKIVSGSFDKSIKLWDVTSWAATNTYNGAHSNLVLMVAFHSELPDIFASCSRDGRVVMWDVRMPRPATLINRGPVKAVPTAIAWQPDSETTIVIGDESGGVMVTDIRNSNGKVQHNVINDRAIFRMDFAPWCGQKVAVCADETVVTVLRLQDGKLEIIYKDDDVHSDFVRGLAWHPTTQELYTCGWDEQIKHHTVTTMENGSS